MVELSWLKMYWVGFSWFMLGRVGLGLIWQGYVEVLLSGFKVGDEWNSLIYGHLSRVLISHRFTFLLGPPMLSSNWLSSGSYGTMCCLSVQCNACTYYRFLFD